MICISIGSASMIQEANSMKPSLVEVRYDLIRQDPGKIAEQLDGSVLQVATCRPGVYTEKDRLRILREAIQNGAVYVDVEYESSTSFINEIAALAKENMVYMIISYHNFDETPSYAELKNILESCYEKGGVVAKIACQVNTKEDNARLLALYNEKGRKIVLGMGEAGKITRISAIELGAEFTFASISSEDSTAPGQLTYHELKSIQKILHNR